MDDPTLFSDDYVRWLDGMDNDATGGPWERFWDFPSESWGVCRPEEVEGEPGDSSALVACQIESKEDADFIALVRTAWPEIVDVLRAANGVEFVFAQGPIESVAHRNDFSDLTKAISRLRAVIAIDIRRVNNAG